MPESYRQFCPLAMAAEIVTTRWTPLVLRELFFGSVRFNDIHRGVPRMSRSLLARRLAELERAGLLERAPVNGHREYRLTPGGEELRPVIEQLAVWGKKWVKTELSREHLDAGLLMWDVHRRIARDRLPPHRLVIHFCFTDAHAADRQWWLLVERGSVDLCLEDPGGDQDLEVITDVRTMVGVWLGDDDLRRALRDGRIRLLGKSDMRRAFPRWLELGAVAGVKRMA
jgi:DNA-binding HxlR family transcriptional regulator